MLVSVCIPCYNAERYIGAAIESVLAQSYRPVEIIVVNDGSTDGSLDVLERYKSRGVSVVSQKNAGQCAAANHAFRQSTGEYIKFFDADDLLSPTYIELQMQRLRENQLDVASASWGRFYNDDLSTFKLSPQSVWRDMDARDWLVEAWMDARPMMQCALWMIPRRILEKSGCWDESLSLINDFEFFARVLCHTRNVLFTPDATLFYRSGIAGSLSGQKSRKAVESAYHSLVNGTSHLLKVRDGLKAKTACANMLQDFIYTYYPYHSDLTSEIASRINSLGGSNLRPSGSASFNKLSSLFGWKFAKHLQLAYQTLIGARS
ncbi:MAG: glycosyltransferase family 2 protein [Pirellula sp.]|jgi:glycosyltransferase involved in cell wall biosynthesis